MAGEKAVGKAGRYRTALREMQDRGEPWEPFLLRESGLPGPRGNLELVAAVADEGSAEFFGALVAEPVPEAESANTREEFLVVCGLVGLGRLLAEGRHDVLPILRRYASDTHWRSREGVAMALQRWGDADRYGLLSEMRSWAAGNRYEQRAAMAALCEPRLLRDPDMASGVLDVLDGMTASLVAAADRREDGFRVLRQALGYGWSVAVAAAPGPGKAVMERRLVSEDPDVRWVMAENLKKNRLVRADPEWVAAARARMAGAPHPAIWPGSLPAECPPLFRPAGGCAGVEDTR